MASVLASRASTPSSTELHTNQSGEHGAAPRHERQRGPIGQKHRTDGPDQGWHPIEPDPDLGALQPEAGRGVNHGRLHPVNADRLLVAHVVLEADVDEIAGFDHLLGGLGKPRLVAIDRRDVEKSRQEEQQAADGQEGDSPAAARGDEVERPHQPVAGIDPGLRLARRPKSGPGIGLGHRFRIR